MNCKVMTSKTIRLCCLSALTILVSMVVTAHASGQVIPNSVNNNVTTEQQTQTSGNVKESVGTSTITTNASSSDANNNVDNGWKQGSKGDWTYYTNGKVTQGRDYVSLPSITGSGSNWYLVDNGVAQSGVQKWMGSFYYFDPTTHLRVDNDYREQVWSNGDHYWYMFGNDGRIISGIYNWQGSIYYFDPSSYLRVDNQYIATQPDGRGYLFGQDGRAVSGVYWWVGTYYYFDPVTHLRVDNDYREQVWSNGVHDWYMFGPGGRIVTGIYNWMGSIYYFDQSSYLKVVNDWRDGMYFGADGRLIDANNTFSGRVISWFRRHEGKLTYSMNGARDGSDGTADCSGAMTEALYEAGASKPTEVYDTESIAPYLNGNGYELVYSGQNYFNPRFGDIVIWGVPGHSKDGNGHIVVISSMSNNPNCLSVNWLTHGAPGTAVSENNYYQYWSNHGQMYQQVFRPVNIARV